VPRQGDRLLRHAFHQVAVGAEHEGVMIDDLLAELGGEHLLRERHADGSGNSLAQRAGGGLDALGVEVLGMSRCQRSELTEMLELVQRHVGIAGQVQTAHRAASSRGRQRARSGRDPARPDWRRRILKTA